VDPARPAPNGGDPDRRNPGYDAAGNAQAYGSYAFGYNNRGRMMATNAGSTNYLYNALGQMIEKSGTAGTTIFMQDESGHLIGEYDGTGNLIEETVWLGDTPVATLQFGTSALKTYYVHTDHLNTPRRITNRNTNIIVWRWDSDPFGNGAPVQNPQGSVSVSYNLRLPGQYYMAETGLNQNYFRDYDPAVGRYLESDPIGLKGGINSYAYVYNSPTSKIDSLGLYGWGNVLQFYNHYCFGGGSGTATGITSIDWGDTDIRAIAQVQALVGSTCAERSIPVNFKMSAQTVGADSAILGRHILRFQGSIQVHCDCTWGFAGSMSSALGYDPYDFDASNRAFVGEVSVWLGGHICFFGTPFNTHITGSSALSTGGTINGTSTCCQH